MRSELNDIEKTEQYLEGKLSPADKALFEQAMQGDPALQQEVMLQQALMQRMEVYSLRTIIREVHPGPAGNRFGQYIVFGAVLICLTGIIAYYSFSTKPLHLQPAASIALPHAQSHAHTETHTGSDTPPDTLVPHTRTNPHTDTHAHAVTLPLPSQLHTPSHTEPTLVTPTPPISKAIPAAPAPKDSLKPNPPADNKNFIVPFKSYTLNADKGGYIRDTRSGASIYFQPEMLLTSKGKTVKGVVKIQYREFRNAADMVCSGIPMTWNKGDSTFNFNSAGMFELYALKGSDTLHLKSGTAMRVNFNMTQDIAGLAFYHLNKQQNKWKEIGPIEPMQTDSVIKGQGRRHHFLEIMGGKFRKKEQEDKALLEAALERPADIDTVPDPSKPVFRFMPSDKSFSADKRIGSVLEGGANAGHTYPAMVQGLLCKDFGVYNCDQAYRLANPISILPTCTDSLGKVIPMQHVLCLINLDYNGSFSFDPKQPLRLSKGGRNILLLFTNDKRVFAFSEEQFRKTGLAGSGMYTFSMTELTKKVKNTNDLKGYLGLKE